MAPDEAHPFFAGGLPQHRMERVALTAGLGGNELASNAFLEVRLPPRSAPLPGTTHDSASGTAGLWGGSRRLSIRSGSSNSSSRQGSVGCTSRLKLQRYESCPGGVAAFGGSAPLPQLGTPGRRLPPCGARSLGLAGGDLDVLAATPSCGQLPTMQLASPTPPGSSQGGSTYGGSSGGRRGRPRPPVEMLSDCCLDMSPPAPPGAPPCGGRTPGFRPQALSFGFDDDGDFGNEAFPMPPLEDDDEEPGDGMEDTMQRPRTHHAGTGGGLGRRPGCLSSAAFCDSPGPASHPNTPVPDRSDYRVVTTGVCVVFFDFDGTLTASPGDRAVRRRKQVELCERAPMLAPRLQALREAGLTLCIISKSTEGTIHSSLEAAGLSAFFDGPIVCRAVGFEGKVGFIEELARKGNLRRLGGRGEKPGRRVLLIDDDVLECERAKARGLQTYAAPGDGGLQEADFDAIFQGLRLNQKSRVRYRQSASSMPPARQRANCNSGSALPRPPSHALLPPLNHSQSASSLDTSSASPPRPASKRRNMIMFVGGCFDS
eukprot:TRINITY_DN122889_c0_g1_i1.p1 TRINITY_DN122889_c0_g1~~TRINITY_DN122889_c0_g1_i1.p1  ORF type:complete len:571 (-),score=70.29 TRINITY_DN122889_c0_g1_i1:122-1750(-)